MGVMIASKTMLAIERALRSDQGAKFRSLLLGNIQKCDDAFRPDEDSGHRSHLGASMIGADCPRQLWYAFRWTKIERHVGKTILLFNRGHLEEARFVSLLEMIGMQVWQVDGKGKQFRVSHYGGHYGSAIDGVVKGCPDMPDEPIAAEFKTSNTKNFRIMEKQGVREAKTQHYVQMQQYMQYYKLRFCLYIMVCKETDELYGEIVPYEEMTALQYLDRAKNIIFRDGPPRRIADSAGAWACKFCDKKDICHNDEPALKNCRTCRYSEPRIDGTWYCKQLELTLTKPMQAWEKTECEIYEQIPMGQ